MKRFLLLMVLSALVSRAEEAKLQKNVVVHADKSLVALKAGTMVQVVKRDEKAITIKVGDKTGTIPVDSFGAPTEKAGTPPPTTPAPAAAKPVAPTVAKPTTAPAPSATPPAAVSTYGKMVEKARDAADKHDKAANPDDELIERRK